jgi:hypothetical protein
MADDTLKPGYNGEPESMGMVGEATRAYQARPDAASSPASRALWVGGRPLQHPRRNVGP